MRRGREKKVRGQNAWDKVGGHEGQTDKENGAGVEGGRPKRTGARTAQTALVRVFWVLRPRSPAFGAKRKGSFWKCQELVTCGRGRKRSSTHPPPPPPWYCSAVPSFSHPGPRPKKPQTDKGALKVLWRGVGAGNSVFFKKKTVGWLRIKSQS